MARRRARGGGGGYIDRRLRLCRRLRSGALCRRRADDSDPRPGFPAARFRALAGMGTPAARNFGDRRRRNRARRCTGLAARGACSAQCWRAALVRSCRVTGAQRRAFDPGPDLGRDLRRRRGLRTAARGPGPWRSLDGHARKIVFRGDGAYRSRARRRAAGAWRFTARTLALCDLSPSPAPPGRRLALSLRT